MVGLSSLCELHCESCDSFEPQNYRRLILTKGYPKSDDNEKRIIKHHPFIFIGKGCKELGSLPDTYYFVVTSNDWIMKIKNLFKGKISNLSTRQIRNAKLAYKQKPCVLCKRCRIKDFYYEYDSRYQCCRYKDGGWIITDTRPHNTCIGWIPFKRRILNIDKLNIIL